jgi:hypothetical protein
VVPFINVLIGPELTKLFYFAQSQVQPIQLYFKPILFCCESLVPCRRLLGKPSKIGRERYRTLSHRYEPKGSAVMGDFIAGFVFRARLSGRNSKISN